MSHIDKRGGLVVLIPSDSFLYQLTTNILLPHSDPIKRREYMKEYLKRYSETEHGKMKIKERMDRYNKTIKARLKAQRFARSEKGKELYRKHNIIQRQRSRLKLMGILGGKCVTCGLDNTGLLQFDHLVGSASNDYRTRGGSRGAYFYYCNNIAEAVKTLQLLCVNCHLIKTNHNRTLTQMTKYRVRLIQNIGPHCSECDNDDIRVLQLHHFNNNGFSERKKFRHHHNEYMYYLKHPDEVRKSLQVLCGNCHFTKQHGLPHK